ncbi:glycosyltransferase family 87 protein [Actinokineospora pegani]|uniref:glycosyltransferase family 87 protein n=1 Tax=Actinokineospora pegani TaxID=2654637 RepID=UPI0018D356CD|nr:glycosyltransferase family 87 protein [Actinokineospora pegani]
MGSTTVLGVAWLVSRVVLVAVVFGIGEVAWREVTYYQRWHDQLVDGTFPVDDVSWQYPPGAALVMLLPRLMPFGGYVPAFVGTAVLVDGLVFVALVRAARGAGAPTTGVWLWVLAIPGLLTVPFTRYDVVVTGLVVLGLVALRSRPGWAGVLAGIGASVKVWPAVVLLGAGKRSWVWAAGSVAVVCGVLALVLDNPFDFLTAQSDRGLEFESVGGAALAAARLFGYPGEIEYRYGSFEIVGPLVSEVAQASVVASVLAALWLGWWRLRVGAVGAEAAADAAMTAVLLFVVTSRVISPQYMIWLVGVGAVCLVSARTTQRPVVALVALAVPLTALEYPVYFDRIMAEWAPGTAILLLRNLLLVIAAFWSATLLWRGWRRAPEVAAV